MSLIFVEIDLVSHITYFLSGFWLDPLFLYFFLIVLRMMHMIVTCYSANLVKIAACKVMQ